MEHRQLGGLLPGAVGDVPAPAHHHGVAAGGVLGVEPQVPAPGGVQGQPLVLQVVAPHQDLEPVRGEVAVKVGGFLLFVPGLVILQVALAFQLGPDLVQGGLAGGALHLVEDGLQIGDLLFPFGQQVHQHPGGGLLFLVAPEVVLGVLAGGVAHIQGDGHFPALVVPVGDGDALHPLFGLVEVGREQLAVQPQLLALFAGGQLLPAGGLLADGPLVHIVHRLVQLLALGAQPLRPVFFGVVAFQHLAEGGPLPDLVPAAVLPGAEESELHRLALRGGHAAGAAPGGVLGFQLFDGVQQAALAGLVQFAGGLLLGAEGPPGCLAADHRAHPRHRPAEGGGHRQVLLAGGRHDGGGAGGQEVGPGRLGRDGVSQARQQLPDLAVLKVHPLEGVDDFPALDQDQVGVAAHQLGAEGVGH